MKKVIILNILANIILFLLFAFIFWEINPINWDFGAIMIYAFLSFTITSTLFIYIIIEKN